MMDLALDTDQIQHLEAVQLSLVKGCRADPATFAEYVLQNEETGGPISLAPIHYTWHDLMSDSNRLIIWSSVETGKTAQTSIARPLWELGRNPAVRVAVVSNTHGQASKIVTTIGRYIEQSRELHEVFPDIKPSLPWTGSALTVERAVRSKDPSVQACGVHGNILGSRIDILILDDILDFENCRTPEARQNLLDWYNSTLAGRLTANAKVWIIGTAFHPEDMLHRFGASPVWTSVLCPILNEDGESSWPARWPLPRIEARRQEIGPLEFARQMLCQARDDAESRFRKDWIDTCLARGRGRTLVERLDIVPKGFRTITGVDLAVRKKSSSDSTCLFTIGIHPDKTREVLMIETGKWSGPDIVGRIIDTHRRYHSIVWVEDNAAQDFILQFTRGASAVPVRNFTTGRNKLNPEFGVESLAAELAGAKWIIPCRGDGGLHPEVSKWIQEMLYYDPAGHTGDRLMASWFAREGARKGGGGAQTGRLDLMAR